MMMKFLCDGYADEVRSLFEGAPRDNDKYTDSE